MRQERGLEVPSPSLALSLWGILQGTQVQFIPSYAKLMAPESRL